MLSKLLLGILGREIREVSSYMPTTAVAAAWIVIEKIKGAKSVR
jgi:hypothetical protein